MSTEFLDTPVPISSQQWKEDTSPIVSIQCITYNHEKYISKAIESFLMQKTTFPVEILIHDDASTDSTANIIREYEKKYPQLIKPIYQTENKYSTQRGYITKIQNERTKGKYVAKCEGDDYWIDECKLLKQTEFLERNSEYCASTHAYNEIYSKKSGTCPIVTLKKTEFILRDFIFKIPTHTSTILMRSTYIQKSNQLPKNILSGDKALYFLLTSIAKIGYTPEIMSNHLIHGNGISQNRTQDIINKDFKILPWILEINPSFPKHAFLASIYRSKFLLKKNTPYFERLKYFYWFSFHLFKDSPKNIKTFLHTLVWLNNKNLFLRVLDFIFQNNFQRRQKLLDRLK